MLSSLTRSPYFVIGLFASTILLNPLTYLPIPIAAFFNPAFLFMVIANLMGYEEVSLNMNLVLLLSLIVTIVFLLFTFDRTNNPILWVLVVVYSACNAAIAAGGYYLMEFGKAFYH
ncbi:hypothetical protein [Pseudovibrio sp. Alg231-02]|uniref:hypothetical protein n=1 Tax=Pseudovibrio sp. Alg231-02 TaxID=1922223 RepID=UPI00131F007E|nr:hypothetical protein [Pseudovibrio sp. Alg231-02]